MRFCQQSNAFEVGRPMEKPGASHIESSGRQKQMSTQNWGSCGNERQGFVGGCRAELRGVWAQRRPRINRGIRGGFLCPVCGGGGGARDGQPEETGRNTHLGGGACAQHVSVAVSWLLRGLCFWSCEGLGLTPIRNTHPRERPFRLLFHSRAAGVRLRGGLGGERPRHLIHLVPFKRDTKWVLECLNSSSVISGSSASVGKWC